MSAPSNHRNPPSVSASPIPLPPSVSPDRARRLEAMRTQRRAAPHTTNQTLRQQRSLQTAPSTFGHPTAQTPIFANNPAAASTASNLLGALGAFQTLQTALAGADLHKGTVAKQGRQLKHLTTANQQQVDAQTAAKLAAIKSETAEREARIKQQGELYRAALRQAHASSKVPGAAKHQHNPQHPLLNPEQPFLLGLPTSDEFTAALASTSTGSAPIVTFPSSSGSEGTPRTFTPLSNWRPGSTSSLSMYSNQGSAPAGMFQPQAHAYPAQPQHMHPTFTYSASSGSAPIRRQPDPNFTGS